MSARYGLGAWIGPFKNGDISNEKEAVSLHDNLHRNKVVTKIEELTRKAFPLWKNNVLEIGIGVSDRIYDEDDVTQTKSFICELCDDHELVLRLQDLVDEYLSRRVNTEMRILTLVRPQFFEIDIETAQIKPI